MKIAKVDRDYHRLRSIEFFDKDGKSIDEEFGYKCETDKKIEFELQPGERIVGFRKTNVNAPRCADFQFIIARQ